jgi:uncharacterized protein (TIGR00369 family)
VSAWPDRLREARAKNDPSLLLSHMPYASFLALSAEFREGELVVAMKFADHLVGDSTIPALHGGTIGALLESAAMFAALYRSDAELLPKTINLTIEYLRSGRAKETFASAVVTKQGRRVLNVHAIAWQDDRDKPIASANVHFLIRSR